MIEKLNSLRNQGFLNWLNKILMPVAIIVAGLLVAGTIFYFEYKNQDKKEVTEFLTSQQAAEKAINYINENLLEQGITASLVSTVEENGIYKLRIKIQNQEYDSYITKDGKLLFTQAIVLDKETGKAKETDLTIGNFSVSQDEICKENEKPIVYFFGSQNCPHCKWEHPIFENVASKFKDYIVFHNNMDSNEDMDVFSKYSTGGIPTLVLGCKYYRVGSGERMGEEEESKILTALICKLNQGQPSNVCNSVQDLINQAR